MGKHTIKLKKYVDIINEYVLTAVAIKPGYLLELTSAGTLQAHATSGGDVLPMIALEDELQGGAITDDIAASQRVQCWVACRGEEAYMLLANGETAVIGSFLISNGDGTLKVYTADTVSSDEPAYTDYANPIVGQALDAVDMSGSSGVDPDGRIKVRIL